MEVVGAIVERELVCFSIQREAAVSDAVGVAPGDAAEIEVAGLILQQIV
jgi:hypothetical protein